MDNFDFCLSTVQRFNGKSLNENRGVGAGWKRRGLAFGKTFLTTNLDNCSNKILFNCLPTHNMIASYAPGNEVPDQILSPAKNVFAGL